MPILVALAAVGVLGFAVYRGYQNRQASGSDNPAGDVGGTSEIALPSAVPDGPLMNVSGGVSVIDPYDRGTWPTGDKVWDLAQAIAVAEGYGKDKPDGSPNGPTRNHNPGDISDGASTYGFDSLITDSKVTTFPDDETGWRWLYNKLSAILNGQSRVYSPSMTFTQLAQKYAGGWQNWVKQVTNDLGVSQDQTLDRWYRS